LFFFLNFSYKQAYLNLTFLGFHDHGKNKYYCLLCHLFVQRISEISSLIMCT